MSSPIDDKTWSDAKDAYVTGTDSLAAIAMRFGISKRAVEKRSSEESWLASRQAHQAQNSVQAKPAARSAPLPPPNAQRRQAQGIDEIEIIDCAIASLSCILAGGGEDTRGIGGIATGLCRLIELRNKLVPKTAADLADMAISLDISPQEFIRALNDQWQKKA
ncbi:hypothetical protein A6S26_05420 [Nostoc sp. ATCC 43529]|nr:hypothetical protein A6S26_05420 [Nostoc sp. ATCC 43529]